jgi:hypothetical protein
VYRSWELDKVRYNSVQELRTGQGQILQCRSQELDRGQILQCRSWELDKGQILQCTGAGNWTEVRYYSAGAGNLTRSDITVYRSWELEKVRYYSVQELGNGQGQILQCTGAGNWTEVRYYNVRPKIDHISANSKHNSKRL